MSQGTLNGKKLIEKVAAYQVYIVIRQMVPQSRYENGSLYYFSSEPATAFDNIYLRR